MLYIFDMGGVVTTTASVIGQIEKILGISESEFYKYCGCPGGSITFNGVSEHSEYNAYETNLLTMCSDGIIGSKEFWHIFSERSGIAVQTDWWHWLFHPVLNSKTVALIKKLRAAGNRVVCGTNTIQSHYLNHTERGDYTYFDQTYASCLMGVSKPNPRFWEIILTAECVPAKDAIFIDDRKVNCEAAATLGIRSIQFTNAEALENELCL